MVKCEDCKKEIKNKTIKSQELLFFEKWSDKKKCLGEVI